MNEQICVGCSRNENEVELMWCHDCDVRFCDNCALKCDDCYGFAFYPKHTKIFLISTKSGIKKLSDTCYIRNI